MGKPFFKPEDFHGYFLGGIKINDNEAKHVANLANAKLEREGKVSYSVSPHTGKWYERCGVDATHRALLINIEPISKSITVDTEKLRDVLTKTIDAGRDFDMETRVENILCHLEDYKPECAHPSEKVSYHSGFASIYYKCSLCNQRVKATKFETEET